MGRTVTPAYRIEYRDNLLAMGRTAADGRSRVDGKPCLMMAWDGRQDGRATAGNLESWRNSMNASYLPGGSNARIAEACGAVPHIHFARIVRQRDDSVVAEYTAPVFEVVC